MDSSEHILEELFRQSIFLTFLHHLGKDLVPSGGLENGDIVFLLVLTDQTADSHSGTKCIKAILINDIDLGTKLIDILLPLRSI